MEKTIDFLAFGWHLTKGSFIKDYLRDQGTAYGSFFKAAWHRKIYLLKEFRMTEKELALFLKLHKNLDSKSLSEKLYQYVFSDSKARESILHEATWRSNPQSHPERSEGSPSTSGRMNEIPRKTRDDSSSRVATGDRHASLAMTM